MPAWRDQAGIWDGIAAYTGGGTILTGGGDAEKLRKGIVTPGFLHSLGVSPLLGRDFSLPTQNCGADTWRSSAYRAFGSGVFGGGLCNLEQNP
ncbi:MAG: hypothetical protein WDO73_23150 [Ignavibacteriota bacterium]